MFKWIVAIKKKKGISRAEFIDYYENKHIPMLREIISLPWVYRRNYVVFSDPLLAIDDRSGGEGDIDFDVLTECIFKTREEAETMVEEFSSAEILNKITADETNFIEPGRAKMYIVEVHGSEIP